MIKLFVLENSNSGILFPLSGDDRLIYETERSSLGLNDFLCVCTDEPLVGDEYC